MKVLDLDHLEAQFGLVIRDKENHDNYALIRFDDLVRLKSVEVPLSHFLCSLFAVLICVVVFFLNSIVCHLGVVNCFSDVSPDVKNNQNYSCNCSDAAACQNYSKIQPKCILSYMVLKLFSIRFSSFP